MSDCRKCAEFDWCVENEECGLFKPKPQTNADRIRVMSDEELLAFLDERNACLLHNLRTETECGEYDDCETCWHDWLRQEATNES